MEDNALKWHNQISLSFDPTGQATPQNGNNKYNKLWFDEGHPMQRVWAGVHACNNGSVQALFNWMCDTACTIRMH